MTVRIGEQSATMTYPDWAWTTRTRATELAKVGDIVYVKVTSAGPSAVHVMLEQDSGAQASLMAIDNSNGEVLAMVGGRDFALSQFNRATQAQRQVGSSFKIYDYTAAMEAGMKPFDRVLDVPTTFATPSGPYTPHDYERGSFSGSMTLIDAFAQSRNIPALRIADKVGIKTVIDEAHRFGVTSNIPTFLPVAIGAADLTLAEQVSAYSVFPNDGIRITPHYIRRVADPNGQPIEQRAPEVHEVISVDIAREMMQLLEAVVQHGTAAAASQMKHAFGGKTGTTNNYTDAWFVGFSPSVTCGTWVGFDDPGRSLGDKETGARAALPIWMDFMKAAVASDPNEQFSKPNEPKKKLDVDVTPVDQEQNAAPAADDSDDQDDAQPQPQTVAPAAAPATPLPPNPGLPNDQVTPAAVAPAPKKPAATTPMAPQPKQAAPQGASASPQMD
jgi:penicillin-binding protein 1A